MEERYGFVPKLLGAVAKTPLRFADGATTKSEVDAQVLATLGPMTQEEKEGKVQPKKVGLKRNGQMVDECGQ